MLSTPRSTHSSQDGLHCSAIDKAVSHAEGDYAFLEVVHSKVWNLFFQMNFLASSLWWCGSCIIVCSRDMDPTKKTGNPGRHLAKYSFMGLSLTNSQATQTDHFSFIVTQNDHHILYSNVKYPENTANWGQNCLYNEPRNIILSRFDPKKFRAREMWL